jgi:cation diffusion facilitator family transporter
MSHDHQAQHDHASHAHHHEAHSHTHGVVDPSIVTLQRGMQAITWSFFGLLATALFQIVVVVLSGSVALLADTLHNIADACTALPLWIAFALARWRPSQRFPYGYGRVEDLAGVVIVLTIVMSALGAGYEAVHHLLYPQPVGHLGAVLLAGFVGFLGNEAVAIWRIKVGKEIGSAALVADGYHARVDGLTSLAVVVGAVGVWFGYPLADPLIGLLITLVICRIVWQSSTVVFTRLLDGVDPEVIEAITHAVHYTPGVQQVTEVRARWTGHWLQAELNIAVSPELSVQEGHAIAADARHRLLHQLRYLSHATIHVDPLNASGEVHHGIAEHTHDGFPPHAHP